LVAELAVNRSYVRVESEFGLLAALAAGLVFSLPAGMDTNPVFPPFARGTSTR
jgi:hypothetical protein